MSSPAGARLIELLSRRGDIQAQGALDRGKILGQGVSGVGDRLGEWLRGRQQRNELRDAVTAFETSRSEAALAEVMRLDPNVGTGLIRKYQVDNPRPQKLSLLEALADPNTPPWRKDAIRAAITMQEQARTAGRPEPEEKLRPVTTGGRQLLVPESEWPQEGYPKDAPTRDPVAAELAQLKLGEARRNKAKAEEFGALDPDKQNLIEAAISRLSLGKQNQTKAQMMRVLKAGNEGAFKTKALDAISDGMFADDQRRVGTRNETIRALNEVQGILVEIKDAGINTNIATGMLEDLNRRFGTSTSAGFGPAEQYKSGKPLARFYTKLQHAFMQWRRAMTGVAFRPEESADYEKVWPGYKNTFPLNMEIIGALREAMEASQEEAYAFELGGNYGYARYLLGTDAEKAPAEDGGQVGRFRVRVKE